MPPTTGPVTGIQAYFQSDVPLPGVGNNASIILAPTSRAGVMAYPVAPPQDTPTATINKATAIGERPSEKSVGPTINNKAKSKTNVPITSLRRFCIGLLTLTESGAVENTPNFAALSSVSLQCGK